MKVEANCTKVPCVLKVNHLNVDVNSHAVVWEIVGAAGQTYRFKNPGGIFFKTAEGRKAFNDCHSEMNDQRYRCKGNGDRQTYEYGIELVGNPPAKPLDPWVVNH